MDVNIGTLNGSKEISKFVMKKVCLPGVSPYESGEGLPYAPVNWPNEGDIWGWKVGKRINSSGFFSDRYLIVPKQLQPPARRCLGGKPTIERFLRSKWPDADIIAFFASFKWNIPVKEGFLKKAEDTLRPRKVPKMKVKEVGGPGPYGRRGQSHRLPRQRMKRSSRQMTQFTTKYADNIIDLCSEGDVTDMSVEKTTDSNNSHSSEFPDSSSVYGTAYPLEKLKTEPTPEDFDDYLNSLDVILAQPPRGVQVSPTTAQLTEARMKLSEILGMDLHSLLSSDDLVTEVVTLSCMLQNDSTLDAQEQSILKLIDEIPVRIRDLKETKKVKLDAGKFFAELDANMIQATNLKTEYNESRKKVGLLQDVINSAALVIADVDKQISVLQSQRAQTSAAIEKAKREIAQLTFMQKMVVECLPKVVREVQLAQSARSEWELKKKIAADQEAAILEKFFPLEGFSF